MYKEGGGIGTLFIEFYGIFTYFEYVALQLNSSSRGYIS